MVVKLVTRCVRTGLECRSSPLRRYLPDDDMPALPVFDLDDPEVGIALDLALPIGGQPALELASDQRPPQAFAFVAQGRADMETHPLTAPPSVRNP